MDGGRDGSLQLWQQGVNTVHGFDDVSAGLLEKHERNRRLAIGDARIAAIFHRVDHVGHVLQTDSRALVVSDYQRPVFPSLEKLIGRSNVPGSRSILQFTLWAVGVGGTQRASDLFQAETISIQGHWIHFDAHGGSCPTPPSDLADTFHLG